METVRQKPDGTYEVIRETEGQRKEREDLYAKTIEMAKELSLLKNQKEADDEEKVKKIFNTYNPAHVLICKLVPEFNEFLNLKEYILKSADFSTLGTYNLTTPDYLYKILTSPRVENISNRDVFWIALERVVFPYTHTQILNVPLGNSEMNLDTCVVVTRIARLAHLSPANYLMIVEALTSPKMSFKKIIHYSEPERLVARPVVDV